MSLSRILANIGTALDSATTGDFLSKVDSDGVFGGVAYSSVTGTPTVLDSANVTNLVDSAYVQLRQSAVSGGGLDSAGVTAILDSDYITNITTASGFQMFEYDATAGQTDFTGSDTNGNTLAYSEYGLLVHYNGILLSGATDYTATDGTTVVLTDSADEGARITIAKWSLASAGGGAGGSSINWAGDRGFSMGGRYLPDQNYQNVIDYFDLTTPGNATDFGDLTQVKYNGGSASNTSTILYMGGQITSSPWYTSEIDYFTSSTPSNASDFGDLTVYKDAFGSTGDGTYGVIAGGRGASQRYNVIEYVTIASPGTATDFGDLAVGVNFAGGSNGGDTYGLFAGGDDNSPDAPYASNSIEYITIATPANASDFGDLINKIYYAEGCSDTTYTVFNYMGVTSFLASLDYVTQSTTGNASDFGDLITARRTKSSAMSNGTYGAWGGGSISGANGSNIVEYVTISTPANATDFGDLSASIYGGTGSSGSPS